MNRRAFLSALPLVACGRRGKPRLNVFNWSSYVAPETIPDFEREFNVEVRYAIYESNEEMLARVFSGNSGWDVVFPTHYYIPPMREQGLLLELDHRGIPNLVHIDEQFQSPIGDPKLGWSVPYMWNSTGIVFDRKLTPPPESWADLWQPRVAGRITMLDDPAEVLGAALRKAGNSINSRNASELQMARDAAITQKPLLRAYLNAEVRDQLVAGDVQAAQLWSTTSQQAIDAAPHLDFAYPKEGFALNLDCAAILRETTKPELAHQFLNYLLRPKINAAIANYTRTATANAAARELLPMASQTNPVLYPSREILQRAEWFDTPTPALQRLRDRLWTEIKSA